MNRIIGPLVFTALMLPAFAAEGQRSYGFDLKAEKRAGDVYERALAMANAKVLNARMNIADKQVVMSKRQKFVVISFLGGERDRGNRIHVVYDPGLDQVVLISAED